MFNIRFCNLLIYELLLSLRKLHFDKIFHYI